MASKKSLVFTILDNQPVRTQLGFGIHENVKLVKVDTEPRKRDGQTIERNSYTQFVKYNSEGKAIAQSEFSFMNIKHDNEYALRNLIGQVGKFIGIVEAVTGVAGYDPVEDYDGTIEELKTEIATKRGARKIQNMIEESYEEALKDHIGENCPTLRLKVVTTWDGQYSELPDQGIFCENADEVDLEDSVLAITHKEITNRDKGLQPKSESADNAKDKKPKKAGTLMDI